MSAFRERYGPWALVGASAGLGEAFARLLAARGLDVFLLARRPEALARLAAQIRRAHEVGVRTEAIDLGRADLAAAAERATAGVEVGLPVYNAAHSAIGPFVERPLVEHLRVLDVNCRGPLALAHLLGGEMARRRRGGIIFMTSLAANRL